MLALLDCDIVAYSCAIYNEEWGWEACREDIDQLMKRIIESVDGDSYLAILSGDNNFRYDVYPDYKANRRDKVDPKYREDAKAYLITNWGAILTDGYEADDRLGIEQCSESFGTSIICSIDKDLKQIPGYHYNWRKNIHELVTPLDGLRTFYRQLLTGDSTDNISGVGGIGAVKSARVINDLTSEIDMYEVCKQLYGSDRIDEMHRNAKLLYILQQEGRMWEPPNEEKSNSVCKIYPQSD
jgi:hypothetical protein